MTERDRSVFEPDPQLAVTLERAATDVALLSAAAAAMPAIARMTPIIHTAIATTKKIITGQ